jgi:uncharacterized membrane protein HdeD (DUF308 family)
MEVLMTDSALNEGLFVGRWWVVVLRGLAAVAFGLLAFASPHLTIAKLVLLFGYFALAYGVFSLLGAIGGRRQGASRWLLVFEGAIGLWAGIATLRAPSTPAMILIFFIWLWAIATGILRIAEAIRLRKQISGELWLVLSGVLGVLFGVVLILQPRVGVVTLASIIAGYALLLGIFEILLGFELRSVGHARLPG